MFSRRILFLLPLFAWLSSVHAQEPEDLVRASFRTLPILSADWNGIFYQPAPEQEMVEIHFRSLARSFLTYEYEGPKFLHFYREDGRDEEGEMRYRSIASVEVSASEMLVFFKPNPQAGENQPEFNLFAIDDSPNGLPANHIAFINLTRANFACRFIDDDMMLRPGLNGPISIINSLNEDLFIGLAVSNENTHRAVLKNRWQFQAGNRHLILLLPPRKEGSFRIRAYRVTEFVGEKERFNPN